MEKPTRYFIDKKNRDKVYTNQASEEDYGDLYLVEPDREFGKYLNKNDFEEISEKEYNIAYRN